MKQRLHKSIAIFLSLVMLLSILPTAAFAEGVKVNVGGSGTVTKYGSGWAGWQYNGDEQTALRATLVYFPNGTDSVQSASVVGWKDISSTSSDQSKVTDWYRSNILSKYLKVQNKDTWYKEYINEYRDSGYLSNFSSTQDLGLSPLPAYIGKGVSQQALIDYFVKDGKATTDLEKLLLALGSNIKDFTSGATQEQGSKGTYRIFLETVVYIQVNGSFQAMTLRDMLAYDLYNQKSLNFTWNFDNGAGGYYSTKKPLHITVPSVMTNMANGLKLAEKEFGLSVVPNAFSKSELSTYGVVNNGIGMAIVSPEYLDTPDTVTASHINIFLPNIGTSKDIQLESNSLDYIGKPLADSMANLGVSVIAIVGVLNQCNELSTDTTAVRNAYTTALDDLGISLEQAETLYNSFMWALTQNDRNSLKDLAYLEATIQGTPSKEEYLKKVNADLQMKSLKDNLAALVSVVIASARSSAAFKSENTEVFTVYATVLKNTATNRFGYANIFNSQISTSEPQTIFDSTVGDTLRPVADITMKVSLNSVDSAGTQIEANMQLGLLRDLLETTLSDLTAESAKQFWSIATDQSDNIDVAIQSLRAYDLSNTFMKLIGWGNFSKGSADVVSAAIAAQIKEKGTIQALNTILSDEKWDINITSPGYPAGTEDMYCWTLSEIAALNPGMAFDILTSKEVSGAIISYFEQQGIAGTTELDTTLKILNACFANCGLKVSSKSDYITLVNSYNALNAYQVIKPITYSQIDILTDLLQGEPVYWLTGSTGNSKLNPNSVLGYWIDEVALTNAVRSTLKILRYSGSNDIPIKSLKAAGQADYDALNSLISSSWSVKIDVTQASSSSGNADNFSKALPKSNPGSKFEKSIGQPGYPTDVVELSKVTPAERVSAYSLARMASASGNDTAAVTLYEDGTMGINGTTTITSTLWAPAIQGDMVYIVEDKTTNTGYRIIQADTNTVSIPVGGIPNSKFELGDTVTLTDNAGNIGNYTIKRAIAAGITENMASYADYLVKNTAGTYSGLNSSSKVFMPGEPVIFAVQAEAATKSIQVDNNVLSIKHEDYTDIQLNRFKVVILVEPQKRIIQYNIITDKAGIDRREEPFPPTVLDNNTVDIKENLDGASLIEWKTSSEDTNPTNWSETSTIVINNGTTNPTVPITEDTTVIYVHYKEDPTPQQSTGQATLTEKRITGSKLLSQISTQGLLSNTFKWDSAGTHGCSCHCGGCSCEDEDGNPDCTCNCGGGNYSTPIDSHYKVIIHNLTVYQ